METNLIQKCQETKNKINALELELNSKETEKTLIENQIQELSNSLFQEFNVSSIDELINILNNLTNQVNSDLTLLEGLINGN